MTRQEEKQQLRTTIRQMEAALAPGYLQNSDAAIAAHLLAMPEYQSAGTIFCFVGTGREIDTRPILRHALNSGKTVCVPLHHTGPDGAAAHHRPGGTPARQISHSGAAR